MPSHRLPTLLRLDEYALNKSEFTLRHENQRKDSLGRKRRIQYVCDECKNLFITKLRDEQTKLFPWLCRSCCSKHHWMRIEYQNAVKAGVTEELREKRRLAMHKASTVMWANPEKRAEMSRKLRERGPDVYSRARRSMRTSKVLNHWLTYQELICVGSYEVSFVNWCNLNKIDFDWQIAHKMPDQRNYIIDAFIKTGVFAGIWIEIKGRLFGIGEQKWNWFHALHPNDSQLWNHERLIEIGVLSK